jgi:hypothetical protein
VDIKALKSKVFPGESGGDYNALFGYSNRPGKMFEGVNLTDMTVDEALEFASPSGPYGQWVKGQIGRVATPMGAFQVVGSTLRAAKAGLGLTGKERMDRATQDRIGQWIYQTQGPGAWEAWGRGGSAPALSARVSTQGGQQMAIMEQQPAGLLDALGIQRRDPTAQGETALPFYQRPTFGNTMDNVMLALNSMTLRPDPNLAASVGQRRESRASAEATNRTAAWLRSIGRDDLADAMTSGALDPKTAASVAITPAADDRTAMIQNYEYWLSTGRSPEEAAEMARAGAGGSVVNVSTGGGKFEEGFAKGDADLLGTVYATGLQAARNLTRIEQLAALLQQAPTGAEGAIKSAAGQFGIATEGLSEIQAAQALINSLVPEQRQPGSGPMSDADLKLFKQSLPRIINQPGGNQMIIATMRGIAQYDAQGAQIVQQLRAGEIDRATAFQMLQDRPDPLAQFRSTLGAAPAAPAGGALGLSPDDLKYLQE